MPKHHETLHASGIYLDDSPGASRVITTADGANLSFNNEEIANILPAQASISATQNLTTESFVIVTAAGVALGLPVANTRPGETISIVTTGAWTVAVKTILGNFLHRPGTTQMIFGGERVMQSFRSNGVSGWYNVTNSHQPRTLLSISQSLVVTGEDFITVIGNNATIDLPLASDRPNEFLTIFNDGRHTTTINTQGSDFIDYAGKTSAQLLGQYACGTFRSNGVDGWVDVRRRYSPETVITSNYTIITDDFILANAAALTVTLPLARLRPSDIITFVIGVSAASLTIAGQSGDFINAPGVSTHNFSGLRARRHLRSNGTDGWYFMDNT